MFLFHPIHFLKFLVKSQPQRSYEKGSYIKKRVYPINASIIKRYCHGDFAVTRTLPCSRAVLCTQNAHAELRRRYKPGGGGGAKQLPIHSLK